MIKGFLSLIIGCSTLILMAGFAGMIIFFTLPFWGFIIGLIQGLCSGF
jgi:hypothetical protein